MMMDRSSALHKILLAVVLALGLALTTACDEPPKPAAPAPSPRLVSKPIAPPEKKSPGQVVVTTAAPVPGAADPAQAQTGQIETGSAKTDPPAPAPEQATTTGPVQGGPLPAAPVTEDQVRRETEHALKSPVALGGAQALSGISLFQSQEKYDFKGRVDPFLPLISEKTEEPAPKEGEEEMPKRILTPLEKMELSQIKLVAVISSSKGPMAMVEEASGKGYEVRVGTYMGRNGGQVTAINPDGLVILEYYKDYQGKRRERAQEVKFHKSEGGE